MKKIFTAAIAALLVAIAVPVLAASSEDNNTCPVRSCWENNASCNNGAYCRDDRSYCRDDSTYCTPQRGHYRGGCGGGYYCGR